MNVRLWIPKRKRRRQPLRPWADPKPKFHTRYATLLRGAKNALAEWAIVFVPFAMLLTLIGVIAWLHRGV